MKLIEILALKHLANQEPMQVILLERDIWHLLLVSVG